MLNESTFRALCVASLFVATLEPGGNSRVSLNKKLMCCVLVEYTITLFRALPTVTPSPSVLPKNLGHASELLLHVLQVRVCSHFVNT